MEGIMNIPIVPNKRMGSGSKQVENKDTHSKFSSLVEQALNQKPNVGKKDSEKDAQTNLKASLQASSDLENAGINLVASNLSLIVEQLEGILQNDNLLKDDSLIEQLDALISQILAFYNGESELVDSKEGSLNDLTAFSSSTVLPINQLMISLQNVQLSTNTSSSKPTDIGQMINTLLAIHKSVNSNLKNRELLNKLELTLGKIAEALLNDGDLTKQTLTKLDGTKNGKTWTQIVESLQNFKGKLPATNSNSSQNLQLDERIREIVSKVLNNSNNSIEGTSNKQVQPVSIDSIPMTKVEQFTIYLQRQQGSSEVSSEKQMLDQIEKVIKASRFMQKDGALQLTLKIRPAHLGDMVVKFTQINGELAVKIAVSTNGVKEMLESNMNQLRHIFSPGQVVIEKQPDPVTQSLPSYFAKEQEQEQQQSQEQAFVKQEEQQEDSNSNNDQLSFKDLLFQSVV